MELNMNNKTQIEKNVMNSIKSGNIYMKPKRYYILITILWTALIGFFSVIAVYIFSIITFLLRVATAQGPAWGARRNLSTLISNFPWWLIILCIAIIAVIIYLARKHSNLYKIRFSVLIPVTIAILFATGFILSYTDLPLLKNNHSQNKINK